jgi:hypothetical protein
MFSLFKGTVSAEEFASAIWESTRDWPLKYGIEFRQPFENSFANSPNDALIEIVYFLAFATDYAFLHLLEKAPSVQQSVRNKFMSSVEQFAAENNCPPIPSGDWHGDGLIWTARETRPDRDSVTNLKQRFDLYGAAVSRRHDKPAAERAAHILAALCGTTDIAFIICVTPLFTGRWNGVKNSLERLKIT